MSGGRLYTDSLKVGNTLIAVTAVDPNGTLSGNSGDLAIQPVPATLWQCQGGTVWTDAQGGAECKIFPFTYSSGLLVLTPLTPGQIVTNVTIAVLTAFDSLAATFTMGTPSTPTALATAGDIDLPTTGQYSPTRTFQATLAENLQLVITPVGATTGAGYALFTLG